VKRNLVFLGPPGSGKGTQAKRLSEHAHLNHISTGDMLRNAVRVGTDLGKRAESFMKKGELVPDPVLVGMIEEQVVTGKLSKGFILDGFPRTVPQAKSLHDMFDHHNFALDAAIYFNVDDQEVVNRLSSRWFCPICQKTYNTPNQLPKRDGICDDDGTSLQRRPDDEVDVVRTRLDVYKKQTAPIIDYYRSESVLTEISAGGTPNEVFTALLEAVA
jgi:adenylate kinase